ncbi:UNVERIFIED_CONTAM: hypothetical protein HDU68_011808 [Siphonaria sp. JEL0065]|nr:hypothetical protein HDU68_011808 [Siphonaria sp. JEL0065]
MEARLRQLEGKAKGAVGSASKGKKEGNKKFEFKATKSYNAASDVVAAEETPSKKRKADTVTEVEEEEKPKKAKKSDDAEEGEKKKKKSKTVKTEDVEETEAEEKPKKKKKKSKSEDE